MVAIPTKNEKFNRVIASFVNPDKNYQVDEVQFPPIDDSGLPSADQHATMKTADGGFLLEGRFDFRTITSPYQAEEMAEIILRRSREAIGLTLNVTFKGYELNIGDIVNITHSSLGFSAKPFRVLGMTFNEDFTVALTLVEHQDSHYTWATKTQAPTLPPASSAQPPPPPSTTSGQMDGTLQRHRCWKRPPCWQRQVQRRLVCIAEPPPAHPRAALDRPVRSPPFRGGSPNAAHLCIQGWALGSDFGS